MARSPGVYNGVRPGARISAAAARCHARLGFAHPEIGLTTPRLEVCSPAIANRPGRTLPMSRTLTFYGLNTCDTCRRAKKYLREKGVELDERAIRQAPPSRAELERWIDGADTARIAALYDRLRVVAPSPVVDLNRAIAHSMAFGPEAGLRLVDEIADAAALRRYAPLPAARGDFLFRAGRLAEARSEFKTAATLTRNARERAFLLARADACDCKH